MTDRLKAWQAEARFSVDVDLPTLDEVDVLVVGAGAAGVAAAVTAAEAGSRVMIVEKYGFAGGAAVAGMSATICGLYLASDKHRRPEQVVFGFAERFRSALSKRGGVTEPQQYGKSWTVAHDPLMWRETADELLVDAGVRVMFHTSVSGALMSGDTYCGAVLESNAGTMMVRAKRVVDASGDAALISRGGYSYRFGDDGHIQNPTMFFRLGGVDVERFSASYGLDTICSAAVSQKIAAARDAGADLPRDHIWIFQSPRPGELLVNATRLTAHDGRMLNVIDPEDFTEAEILGRRQVREYAAFLSEHVPGCEDSFVNDTGVEAGIRQTRSIVGVEKLTDDDVASARKRADGICRSPWPIELHDGGRPKLHWLLDDYCDVPYLSLVPEVGENIIVAGRCLSATHRALASARVTAQCFEYGHAAGVAAAMSADSGTAFRELDVHPIRARMAAGGSVFDG